MPTRKGDPRQRRQSRFQRAALADQRLLAEEQASTEGVTAGAQDAATAETEPMPPAHSAPRRNPLFPVGVTLLPARL